MADDHDVIGVLRQHLEEIYSALSNARSLQECNDLADALRHGRTAPTASWLTKELTRSIRHIEGYLEVEVDVSGK